MSTSDYIIEQMNSSMAPDTEKSSGSRRVKIDGKVSSSAVVLGDDNYINLTIINNNNESASLSSDKVNCPNYYVPKLGGSSVFVERTKDIETTIEILLGKNQSTSDRSASVSPLVGLWGPPGYGKTTLAKMVCQHTSIKEKFTGGVFFIETSSTSDGEQELRNLCEKVNNSYIGGIQPSTLLEQWNERPTLIVLDSVGSKEKLDSLLEISESDLIKWLITTQNKEIFVRHQNYALIEVRPLNKIEVIAALQAPFGDAIDFKDERLSSLADLLYHWPILLGVALEKIQGLKQESSNPKFILEEVIEDIKFSGRLKFDHGNRINDSLEKALGLLTQEEREQFLSLFIFSSDLDIPFSVIAHTLDLSVQSVKVLCSRLHKLALVKLVSREKKIVQTFSFLRKYLLSDNDIREKLIYINANFVKYYEDTFQMGSPNSLSNDIPSEELKFLKRVYKRQWRLREKSRAIK